MYISFRRPGMVGFVVLAAASTLAATVSARGQEDLIEKLEDLNVRHTTDHYELAGTIPQSRLVHHGQALEFIYREYARGFAQLLPGQEDDRGQVRERRPPTRSSRRPPARSPQAGTSAVGEETTESALHRVIVLGSRKEYERFGRAYLAGSEHTRGMFLPAAKLLLILDEGDRDETYEILFHEAFHQFMSHHIKNPPVWLDEGLATHYGDARPSGNGLKFVRPSDRLAMLRRVIGNRNPIRLFDVVYAQRREFYDKTQFEVPGFRDVRRSNVYYAEASTLVHLLLSDPQGLKRLQSYIRDLAESDGTRNKQITDKYFDRRTCDGLSSPWVQHVERQ